MKLLFDQNISFRVLIKLKHLFPDCDQVRTLQLENKSDIEIWRFSKENGYTIVTFDADFYDMVTLYGHPPKVIWLRTGNITTENLISVITSHAEIIQSFLQDAAYENLGCLEISGK